MSDLYWLNRALSFRRQSGDESGAQKAGEELAALCARLAEAERLLRAVMEDYVDSVGQPRREAREYIARLSVNGQGVPNE
jgi:hypothetical protein